MTHAVFFDRDGIVNVRRPGDYVTVWDEFHFLPDIFTVLPRIQTLGYRAIVITNQRGVALGRMSVNDVDAIHARMQETLHTRTGSMFDDIFVCSHDNKDGCDCRKPQPGLLLRAAAKWGIELPSSWMIGDTESDVVAGNRAGCRTILVGQRPLPVATFQCESLVAAADVIAREGISVMAR